MNRIAKISILLIILGGSNVMAQKYSPCDLHAPQIDKDFSKVTAEVNDEIKSLYSLRMFTNSSDAFFSKLIEKEAQPLLKKWSEKNFLDEKTMDDALGKWREDFFGGMILPNYKLLRDVEKIQINNSFTKITNIVYTPKRIQYLQGIFNEVKKSSISYINSSKIDAANKVLLSDRINSISMEWFESIEKNKFEDNPLYFLRTSINYQPLKNTIFFGPDILKYKYEDTIRSTIAFNIGLSFSPCLWTSSRKEKFPFQNVINCLQDKNSIWAKSRDDSKINDLGKSHNLSSENIQIVKDNPYCNLPFYPYEKMQKSQVNFSFADWFSAEVMATYTKLSIYMNDYMCKTETSSPLDASPPGMERLTKIYYANPDIRKKLNIVVTNNPEYCKIE